VGKAPGERAADSARGAGDDDAATGERASQGRAPFGSARRRRRS
jgi:hypothetical protein